MPEDPLPYDFGFPPAPGGGFPAIMGSPGDETPPDSSGSAANYTEAYLWEVW